MIRSRLTLPARWCLTALCAATLAACGGSDDPSPTAPPAVVGGGGGSNGGGGGGGVTTLAVSGVLVTPTSTSAASREVIKKLISGQRQAPLSVACPSVPDGYDPLASVAVQFKDASGATQATLTTDACGAFSGSVPAGVTTVTAAPGTTAEISQPISAFSGSTPAVVSALPSSATLVISVLQDLGGGKLALTVTDSATGKAVLGLAPSAFGFSSAAVALTPTGVTYGASTAQAASVGIVLDASGSMGATVGSNGKTAIQLASAATHELLDGLTSGSDEAGMVIFDNKVVTMNDAGLASSYFRWGDNTGAATAAYTISANGLTTNIAKLRPVADLYDRQSLIYYGATSGDPVHPGTGNVRLLSGYAFFGSTAFYDATSSGISLLSAAANSRRIVVAMTDGVDNQSAKTSAAVISEATAAGIPLYLVAFGAAGNVNESTMQTMAQQTGGEYKRVEGDDITGLFQSIQTGIRFQYVASFGTAFASGATVTTTINASGLTVSRDLVIR